MKGYSNDDVKFKVSCDCKVHIFIENGTLDSYRQININLLKGRYKLKLKGYYIIKFYKCKVYESELQDITKYLEKIP